MYEATFVEYSFKKFEVIRFAYSKSAIKTVKRGVKYVQS